MKTSFPLMAGAVMLVWSCSAGTAESVPTPHIDVALSDVAQIFSALPIRNEQVGEVFDAVSSSSGNGYDEEYLMKNLFDSPGSGVGDKPSATRAASYGRPLRVLVEEYLESAAATRAGGGDGEAARAYIDALTESDIQLYWPYSENWDGETLPVITFDPGSEASANVGYELKILPDGSRSVEEVTVDEAMARNRPVWVVNRNDDSSFTSLEMLRRDNPSWSEGGSVVISRAAGEKDDVRTLVLKDFTMKRQFDTWFAGASEFFVKCGAVENFTASTEAELLLYSPTITDFMIVVRRRDFEKPVPFDIVLVSDWTDQLEEFAFMITEDDGGTATSWKAETTVKINSKAYGMTVDLPFKTRDDIVWRGMLSGRFLDASKGKCQHFGDVDLTFDFL